MTWITCPGCGLKHSARPDGLCPRCRTRTAPAGAQAGEAPGLSGAAPSTFGPPPDHFSPRPFAGSEPLPTSPVGPPGPLPAPSAPGDAAKIEVGPLVSRTFSIWWAHLGKFTALLVLAYLPIVVAGALAAGVAVGLKNRPPGVALGGAEAGIILFLVVALLAACVLMLVNFGGVTFGTLQHLAGRPFSFGAMFGAGVRRAWPLLVVGVAGTVLVLLGLVALIVPGIVLALGLAVAYPIVVAERVSSGDAIRRSLALTKGSRGTLFVALFVVFLAMWGTSLAGNLLTAALKSAGPAALVATLLTVVVQASMSALSTVLCAVAYHDLRLAKEGVDTTDLANVFE